MIDISPEALAALPSLKELRVPSEMLEAVEDLLSSSGTQGVEPDRIELVLRLVAFHLQWGSVPYDRDWFDANRKFGQ